MTHRTAEVECQTLETDVRIRLDLDGEGHAQIETGIGFLEHMLTLLARHGRFDLDVEARGDRHVDDHHTTEDVGIVLGNALRDAVGDKRGIARYGWDMRRLRLIANFVEGCKPDRKIGRAAPSYR